MVSGPQILGSATNVLFNGIIGKRLAPGTTKAQAIRQLREHGESQIAAMVSGMHLTPGVGVNIDELGRVLVCARSCIWRARRSTTSKASLWPDSLSV